MKHITRTTALAAVWALLACAAQAGAVRLENGQRVLFLGDSITQDGRYIAFLSAYLMAAYPERRLDIVNLGLGSETVSGLSEPHHPYPRPNLHERLDRALAKTKPDLVFACYGMNDGIYYPFSEERFTAYREGIMRLIYKLQGAGVKGIVLLTPPPFDPGSIEASRLQPQGREEYGYRTPYRGYDSVLSRYGEWILSLEKSGSVDLAIDVHTPVASYIAGQRSIDPHFKSGDGVHPNDEGHWIMASAILEALGEPETRIMQVKSRFMAESNHDLLKLVLRRHQLLSSSWRVDVGHKRPGEKEALPLEQALPEAGKLEATIREKMKKIRVE